MKFRKKLKKKIKKTIDIISENHESDIYLQMAIIISFITCLIITILLFPTTHK